MQYTFVTKFLPVDFEGTLYNSVVSTDFPLDDHLVGKLSVDACCFIV